MKPRPATIIPRMNRKINIVHISFKKEFMETANPLGSARCHKNKVTAPMTVTVPTNHL